MYQITFHYIHDADNQIQIVATWLEIIGWSSDRQADLRSRRQVYLQMIRKKRQEILKRCSTRVN